MTTRRACTRTAVALGLVVALAAGCGSDGDDDAGDPTPTTTTTEASTTSSTAEGTTTTTTTGGAALPDQPPRREDAASGSGCAPGGSDDLPDGWWYGTLAGPVGADVDFDLACYYIGAAAEAEAASRGDEVNNDYYVVNENPQVRTLTVAAGASATCVEMDGNIDGADCSPTDVAGDWAVWLRVQGGEVDRIVEQYAP